MYPIQVFPSLWRELDSMVREGHLLILDEVYEELKKADDDLTRWVEERLMHLIPLDVDIQLATRDAVLAQFPRLVDSMKGRSAADPWIIGLAIVRGGAVVTGERNDGNERRPRIPYVCQSLGVPCCSTLEFIRSQGWSW